MICGNWKMQYIYDYNFQIQNYSWRIMEEPKMRYLSDIIGEEYKEWRGGDIILITAPTGSGKTHFALHELLKYAIESKCRILYLVNRKILKDQLDETLAGKISVELYDKIGSYFRIQDYIMIRTYQSIETDLKAGKIRDLNQLMQRFDYVVYDECHYFLSDSTYNTSTELSYRALRLWFDAKIQIFISATIKRMEKIIEQSALEFTNDTRVRFKRINLKSKTGKHISYRYSSLVDYSYVRINLFNDQEELVEKIKASTNNKWLIFTDSIERGIHLKNSLSKSEKMKMSEEFFEAEKEGIHDLQKNSSGTELSGIDISNADSVIKKVAIDSPQKKPIPLSEIVFIDADFKRDEAASAAVTELNKENLIKKKIIITTSVMDNGISFHDLQLRNIVIFSETEEEFIQMLGRKRADGKEVNVYLCKRNQAHFLNRAKYAMDTIKLINRYDRIIKNAYPQNASTPFEVMLRGIPVSSGYQQSVLEDIMQQEYVYQRIKKCIYFVNGIMDVNYFASEQLHYLASYYMDVADRFRVNEAGVDPYAFVKVQLGWLGFSDDKIEDIILEASRTQEDTLRDSLAELCNKMESKEINTQECIKIVKQYIKELKYFARKSGKLSEEEVNSKMRTDRTISSEIFNNCMQAAGLQFSMSKPSGRSFMIKPIEIEKK